MRKHGVLLFLVALAAMLVPTTAAGNGEDALRDCVYDGELDREYSTNELREAEALVESRADISEYYDCQEVLERALIDAAGKARSGKRRDSSTATGAAGEMGGTAPPSRPAHGGRRAFPPPRQPTREPAQSPRVPPAPTPEDLAMLAALQNNAPSNLANLGNADLGDLPWKAFLLGVGVPLAALLMIDVIRARMRRPVKG